MKINEIKQKLGENTEKIEKNAKQLWTNHSHYYTNLEPYQRGLILLGILLFLIIAIYYLTKEDKKRTATQKAKEETAMEEKFLKKIELLKKLRE